MKTPPPRRLIDEGSLRILVFAPSVWAGHFLLAYWAAAVWCAKAGGSLMPVHWVVWALTLVALVLVALIARRAVAGYGGTLIIDESLTEDSPEERERFLGHATLLLCALSAVAIVFTALPTLVFGQC